MTYIAVLDIDILTLCISSHLFHLCQIKPPVLGLYIVTSCHSGNLEIENKVWHK